MRKLDVSAVSPAIGLPVKSGTVIHIQNAYVEAVGEAIKGLIGSSYNPAVLYILQGMVNSGSGANYVISAGSCFYNGEMYICDGATFSTSGSNVAVCTITTSFFTAPNADGVQHTDGIVRNIHQIRKVTIAPALGGSGISNYVDAQRINTNIPPVNLINGTGISVTGAYPNLTITNTQPQANKVLACRDIFLGDMNSDPTDPYTVRLAGGSNGLAGYLHTFPTPMPTGNFWIGMTFGNKGHDNVPGFADNYMCSVQVGWRTQTQMWFACQTSATSNVQSMTVQYFIYSLD